MKKFLFCATTNAFQIEGGRHLGKRQDSIWDEFTKRRFHIPPPNSPEREINSVEEAADFYHQYKIDAQICNRLKLDALIYCIDWARIFPKDPTHINVEGVKFYQNVFKEFIKNNVRFIPVLFHWDTPLWAQKMGGWENRKCINWFKKYAKTIFKYLGKYFEICFVSDENSSFTIFGYLDTYFPPERNNIQAFVKAVHHLAMASAATNEAFMKAKKAKFVKTSATLGIAHDWSPPIPYPLNNLRSQKAAQSYNEWYLGLFYDPYLLGTYSKSFYNFIKENNVKFNISSADLAYLKKYRLQLIGWNYYRPFYVSDYEYSMQNYQKPSEPSITRKFQVVYPKQNVKYTNWNWTIDSSQIIPGLKLLQQRYGKNIPIMILENGMGVFDDKSKPLILDKSRIIYLQDHIKQFMKARKLKINLIGYSLWTYCDIFSPSGGYRKDYGLVSVNFKNKNKTRRPKLSYIWYRKAIQTNGLDLSTNWKKMTQELKTEIKDWQKHKLINNKTS